MYKVNIESGKGEKNNGFVVCVTASAVSCSVFDNAEPAGGNDENSVAFKTGLAVDESLRKRLRGG